MRSCASILSPGQQKRIILKGMRTAVFIVALFLSLSSFAYAASTGTDFSDQSLFLSSSAVTEGETVTVYTNVVNNSSSAFSGSVSFLDGPIEIARIPVNLPAGESHTYSSDWQPRAGVQS